VAGWEKALRKYGSWRFKRVLAPAIDVARDGFVVDQTFISQTTANVPYFDDIPSTAALYLDPDGTEKDLGAVIRNPDLAKTYERIARHGADGFYRGPVARAIAAAAQKPPTAPTADKTWRPGLLTVDDLQHYRAIRRKPTRVNYRGYDVYSMAPPSSGGSTVGAALNLLERIPRYQQLSEADKIHYFLEASRYAFADRNVFIADPAFIRVPLRGLLSDSYADERVKLIGATDPNAPVPAGDPWAHQRGQGPKHAGPSIAHPAQSTTHLTVADRRGTVVSYTFTIESTGGNGIVVPGWGFLLNNELTDFNIDDPDHANAPAGGKRPRSSIAPTYVERNRRPFLAVGSPGGATIITTVLQILTERIDFGRTLPEAIADPRGSQRNPAPTATNPNSPTAPEQAFLDRYQTALAARGHTFSAAAEIGAATGIEFLRGGGFLAAAEPVRRGGGSAQVLRP
jgi:gamma-glutamyltranspeptidase/glutathione hydrolase